MKKWDLYTCQTHGPCRKSMNKLKSSAGGGICTRMGYFLDRGAPPDSKSGASTCFATPACSRLRALVPGPLNEGVQGSLVFGLAGTAHPT